MSRPLPSPFQLDEIRPYCAHLTWDAAARVQARSLACGTILDFGQYPLVRRRAPPTPCRFATRQIQKVGAAAKAAKRVEVPFEFIGPADGAWWTRDNAGQASTFPSRQGRAATKRQHFTLGHGTSQHVLIAGRTGSGKSTLAWVTQRFTNLALNYSPDEIDLYLIDFRKKGVEFKVYRDAAELAARERGGDRADDAAEEFGISVLSSGSTPKQCASGPTGFAMPACKTCQWLSQRSQYSSPAPHPADRRRGFRSSSPRKTSSRRRRPHGWIVWFARVAPFGVHVILGSAEPGRGVCTLAPEHARPDGRPDRGFQCSENDAHLILSENNIAPRMLSRPGEAIYNDANGAPEGNHFFQVVWLTDERREAYLKQLYDMAKATQADPDAPRSCSRGDAPGRPGARNPMLHQRLAAGAWPDSPRSTPAWVGDAISIKDPTSALFRRQGGNHLLIVGQNDEAAIGVAISTLLSLAAQWPVAPVGYRSVRGSLLCSRRHPGRSSQLGRAGEGRRVFAARGRHRRLA